VVPVIASLRAAAVTLPLVLTGAADWELVVKPPALEAICAKSEETCRAAIGAVRAFGLFADLGIVEMRCIPHPNCFPEASNCIAGYNCGARR
jgi:hypothetical protein